MVSSELSELTVGADSARKPAGTLMGNRYRGVELLLVQPCCYEFIEDVVNSNGFSVNRPMQS